MPDATERRKFELWLVKSGYSRISGNVGGLDKYQSHRFYNMWVARGKPPDVQKTYTNPRGGKVFGTVQEELDAYNEYRVSVGAGSVQLSQMEGVNSSILLREWRRTGSPARSAGVKQTAAETAAAIGVGGEEFVAAASATGALFAPEPTPEEQLADVSRDIVGAREGLNLVTGGGEGRPESERPLPGETAAEWRVRTGNQSAVLGDPVQEEHLGRRGFWNANGEFVSTDEFGDREVIDFDASRVERQEPPGETEGERRRREAAAREFGITEQRLFQESEATRLFREQKFEFEGETRRLEQEQFQLELAGEREERLAQLAAQPISWLQHAALSGQQPVVQPWMIPLMRPGQNLQVGQPIPGFQPSLPGGAIEQGGFLPGTATPAPVGNQFANLPELRRPSAQLFARMGPTAQQQFLGFRQARTGIPPQETLFRQRQTGPPGSSGGGFQQQRLRV